MSLADDQTVAFDSLPYYDNDLEQYPILKEKVEKELAREPKPPQAMHPLVPPPLELFKVRVVSPPVSRRSGAHHRTTLCWPRSSRV